MLSVCVCVCVCVCLCVFRIEAPYADSYKIFCESVVRQRLIVDQEVLKMNQLRRTFVNIVKKHEDLDASDYR